MRLQQMEVSCETKTKDNVFVLIRVAVQYQVNDDEESIKNAHYRLTNPKQQIESYVFDVVRSSVPKIDLDDVFTTKEEIAQNIKSELTSAMSSCGYAWPRRTRARRSRSRRSRRRRPRRRARRSRRRRTRRPSSSRGRASRASGRPSWRGCASRSTPSRARCRTWTPRPSWTS